MKNQNPISSDALHSDLIEELECKYLTFWVHGQLMGISISNVMQIVGICPITPVPDFPSYCKGIINLRGTIIPLIDMRLRLSKPEAEYTDRTCIVVCYIRGRDFGFIVDEVHEVADIRDDQIAAPPHIKGETASKYLTGVAKLEGNSGQKIVLLVDAAKILNEYEYEALAQQSEHRNQENLP